MRKLVFLVTCALLGSGCLDSLIPAHTSPASIEPDMSQPTSNPPTPDGGATTTTPDGG